MGRMSAALTWTDIQVAQLKALRGAGCSFAAVARIIGDKSRNACLSKSRKLGLPGRIINLDAPAPKPRKRHNDGVMAAPRSPGIIPKDEPTPIGPLHDFPPVGACRFIRGEVETGSDWRCCGADAPIFAKPYCGYHMAKVYR